MRCGGGGYRSREMEPLFSLPSGLIMQTSLPRTHINFNVARKEARRRNKEEGGDIGPSCSMRALNRFRSAAAEAVRAQSMGQDENFMGCTRKLT